MRARQDGENAAYPVDPSHTCLDGDGSSKKRLTDRPEQHQQYRKTCNFRVAIHQYEAEPGQYVANAIGARISHENTPKWPVEYKEAKHGHNQQTRNDLDVGILCVSCNDANSARRTNAIKGS